MALETLRNLNTGGVVIGQDWQDLRNNFLHLANPPVFYLAVAGNYAGASSGWDVLDADNLQFEITVGGGVVVFFYGAMLRGSDAANYAHLALKIGPAYPIRESYRKGQAAGIVTNINLAFPYPLAAGTYEVSLLFKTVDANLEIVSPFVGAWAI